MEPGQATSVKKNASIPAVFRCPVEMTKKCFLSRNTPRQLFRQRVLHNPPFLATIPYRQVNEQVAGSAKCRPGHFRRA